MRFRQEIQAVSRQAGVSVVFFRHGESEANVEKRINDDPRRTIDLTELGRRQAAMVAKDSYDHAYASEFPRAQQTAKIILSESTLPLHVDARINERKSGMDNRPVREFNEKMRIDPAGFRPEGGESFLEEMERLKSFLDDMASRHPGKKILAVSHENPILAALALCGMDPGEAALGAIANCQKVEITWPKS